MIVCLVVIRPSNGAYVMSFESPAEVLIGRSSSCRCRLDFDPLVSRRHVLIQVTDNRVTLRDLESRNGLRLNGVQYGGRSPEKLAGDRELANGDMIQLGDTVLSVLISPDNSAVRVDSGLLRRARQQAVDQSGQSQSFTQANLAADPAIRIPGYAIDDIIGSGGMGIVYHARDAATGAEVAIKTMNPGVVIPDELKGNFRREIEVTKSIDHPNIIKFHDSGITDQDRVYLVLEYVDGGDLGQLLDRSPGGALPVATAYDLALQIAAGMAHAHALGIVHRDIKPQNILLTREGKVKISDLGMAKHFAEAGASGFTASSTGGGTMSYMPPEQLSDFRHVKPMGDVFSVGATIYEMLAGKPPYDTKHNDRIKVVSEGLIIPLYERQCGHVPEKLVDVIHKCLAFDPFDRYPDCIALHDALRNAIP